MSKQTKKFLTRSRPAPSRLWTSRRGTIRSGFQAGNPISSSTSHSARQKMHHARFRSHHRTPGWLRCTCRSWRHSRRPSQAAWRTLSLRRRASATFSAPWRRKCATSCWSRKRNWLEIDLCTWRRCATGTASRRNTPRTGGHANCGLRWPEHRGGSRRVRWKSSPVKKRILIISSIYIRPNFFEQCILSKRTYSSVNNCKRTFFSYFYAIG